MLRALLLCMLAPGASLGCPHAVSTIADPADVKMNRELIVAFSEGVSAGQISAVDELVERQLGLRLGSCAFARLCSVTVPEGVSLDAAKAAYETAPEVEYAEPSPRASIQLK